ncbi:flavonol synthase [Marivirga lumbricoides]|uniref:Flavonol synthase n=1 Tax=Marivirga lumbricoides TaxID=1046115 RepID=A0A2T4DI15_9BACT|nr:flavonol synthase [Marivirga lumbricoides]
MSNKLYNEIPSLDLRNFTTGSAADKKQFVNDLGNAYNTIGFVAIKGHYLSDELSQKLYQIVERFFKLSTEQKKQYENPELAGQRGYTSTGREQAKGHSVPDLKEFYQIGQFVPEAHPMKPEYPDNLWPAEIPEMAEVAKEVYQKLEKTGVEMLRAIALYLELPEDFFDKKVEYGNSILRAIHYPPIENPDALPDGAVRAAQHGDINLITLLMGASADGLQVLRRDGEWIPITALPNQLVVNVGDMLARLTNDKLKSTIHRVVNPPKEQMKNSRFSIPFFMHPISQMDLTCLNSCVDDENPKHYKDMTAGEFLQERLAEIGLLKKK